jgi:hypothetical protein
MSKLNFIRFIILLSLFLCISSCSPDTMEDENFMSVMSYDITENNPYNLNYYIDGTGSMNGFAKSGSEYLKILDILINSKDTLSNMNIASFNYNRYEGNIITKHDFDWFSNYSFKDFFYDKAIFSQKSYIGKYIINNDNIEDTKSMTIFNHLEKNDYADKSNISIIVTDLYDSIDNYRYIIDGIKRAFDNNLSAVVVGVDSKYDGYKYDIINQSNRSTREVDTQSTFFIFIIGSEKFLIDYTENLFEDFDKIKANYFYETFYLNNGIEKEIDAKLIHELQNIEKIKYFDDSNTNIYPYNILINTAVKSRVRLFEEIVAQIQDSDETTVIANYIDSSKSFSFAPFKNNPINKCKYVIGVPIESASDLDFIIEYDIYNYDSANNEFVLNNKNMYDCLEVYVIDNNDYTELLREESNERIGNSDNRKIAYVCIDIKNQAIIPSDGMKFSIRLFSTTNYNVNEAPDWINHKNADNSDDVWEKWNKDGSYFTVVNLKNIYISLKNDIFNRSINELCNFNIYMIQY